MRDDPLDDTRDFHDFFSYLWIMMDPDVDAYDAILGLVEADGTSNCDAVVTSRMIVG